VWFSIFHAYFRRDEIKIVLTFTSTQSSRKMEVAFFLAVSPFAAELSGARHRALSKFPNPFF